ncbi:MAG TPA: hypothetical protein VKL22_02175 [Actinomycetota bacterium]|nr:hypothetical protein [Actinomycetota bacterium]
MHPILLAELTRLHSEELLRGAEEARQARLASQCRLARRRSLKAAIGTRLVSAGSRLLQSS